MARIDDLIEYLFGEVGVPKSERKPNEGVNQVLLPANLRDRPGPEKAAYVFDQLKGGPIESEDHSEDVTEIPWSDDWAKLGPEAEAQIAGDLASQARNETASQQQAQSAGPPSDLQDPDAIAKMLAGEDPSGIAKTQEFDGNKVYTTGHLGSWQPLEDDEALEYIDMLRRGKDKDSSAALEAMKRGR